MQLPLQEAFCHLRGRNRIPRLDARIMYVLCSRRGRPPCLPILFLGRLAGEPIGLADEPLTVHPRLTKKTDAKPCWSLWELVDSK